MTEPAYRDRIDALSGRARRDREQFEPPTEPPDEDRALEYLREGFGQAVWCYIDARTGEWAHLDPADFDRLETAMNEWLDLYARCYGVEIKSDVPVRTAAELLIETHNVHDTARVLTHVPDRSADDASRIGSAATRS